MTSAREELLDALRAAIDEVSPGHSIDASFETPRQASHGDLAVTAAMPLARTQRRNPRELAAELIAALRAKAAVERWVEKVEIAGPGFINLHLRAAARQRVVAQVLAAGAAYGTRGGPADAVLVEFVSANPTGPLHVGHARQAALGDAICNLLETQGRRVTREFYYNDAGVQIETLTASVKARLDGLAPGDPGWPEKAYNGDYIADIAADFRAGKTVRADDREFTASGRVDDLDGIRQFAVAYLRHEQDLDLAAFGVRFDNYYLESSLYADGRVQRTVERLVASGKTYEADGALWLRTTEYGDDKDRVMRKSDGSFTYFVPDIAYHLAKFERGFAQAINLQGTDHHGTIARVRAGLQAANPRIPPGYPEYILNTMVRVERGGVEVKLSKRAGSYVTLRDLIDWTGRDAVRFFMLSRKADTEFTFDVDLALKQNDENPVFYVQYAHARICSVMEQAAARSGGSTEPSSASEADLALLVAPSEVALLKKLADYPDVLAAAALGLAPHEIAFYLRDLAAAFHSYYGAERFLVDDPALARARLALLGATRQVIANALAVLGVGAPVRMARESETEIA
ncbi:MAG TPA: arginine--tRNA ligase [Caldimonas sp.]|jgi:arginyl-tRNA synthetase|nr:arginine--tRNA ligase [Caldimonas sp.]HEX2540922.1 arginine--tRNA ligase [Caldimonas sp.]